MSNNEKVLNSNESLIRFTSDYEYVLGAQTGRSLEFVGLFRSADFMIDQIEQIKYDLEATAKYYAEQQGLAPGEVGWGTNGWNEFGEPILRVNTGTLYNGIKAVRTGQTVHLKSEAKDKYGHYYGGHVEFGHQGVPPRPHLRPALYTVSEASRGKLRSALHNLLTSGFNGNMNLMFGTGGGLSSSYYRKGPGNVVSHLSSGTRKEQAKYHFGSMRNNSGKNISKKAQTFRQSFQKTAKKSMGWGKQKSLNQAQRRMYNNRNVRRGAKRQSRNVTNRLKKLGYSGTKLKNEKSRQMRRLNNSKTASKASKQRFSRRSLLRQRAVSKQNRDNRVQSRKNFFKEQAKREETRQLRIQRYKETRYYANNYLKFTGHYGNTFTQKVNYMYSEKALNSQNNKISSISSSSNTGNKLADGLKRMYSRR